MDNSVDNCNIGRNADIFSPGQAIENIGGGILVTGVMGFLFPIIPLCYQRACELMALPVINKGCILCPSGNATLDIERPALC